MRDRLCRSFHFGMVPIPVVRYHIFRLLALLKQNIRPLPQIHLLLIHNKYSLPVSHFYQQSFLVDIHECGRAKT